MAQYSRFQTYIDPLIKTPKSKAYTMMILSIAAIIFFGVFAIRPTALTIVSLQSQINQAQDTSAKLSQKIQALSQAQAILDKYGSQEGILKEAIPATPNVTLALKLLEDTASASAVQLGNVQFHAIPLPDAETPAFPASGSASVAQTSGGLETAPGSAPVPIPLSFSVIGTESNISGFLHAIAQTRRLIVINELDESLNVKDNTRTVDAQAQMYQSNTQQ